MTTTETIVLEASLVDHAPPVGARNPFRKATWTTPSANAQRLIGIVQLVVRTEKPVTLAGGAPPEHIASRVFLRFVDVRVSNEKNWPLYVLLSRANAPLSVLTHKQKKRSASDEALLRTLESQGEIVPLDIGPGGQWVGAHLPTSFEQEIFVYDPLMFASVVICKPSAARPPTVLPQVVAHGIFSSYLPPAKSAMQVQAELDALATKLQNTVMEMDQTALDEDQLDLDTLQRNARELFRLFDQDKSNSIDFDEYKQMLAYRGVNILDSKAMRLFQLVDDQKKGYIDEREFVIALYITNTLRLHAKKHGQQDAVLSPVDIFYQLDSDRDGMLNIFEYNKAMQLLGITLSLKQIHASFPKGADSITIDQFKAVWLKLVDVRTELRNRGITPRSLSAEIVRDHRIDKDSPINTRYPKHVSFPFSLMSRKRRREDGHLKDVLLQWITQEETDELEQALKAKEEVCRLEKDRRERAQEEKRALFSQQRQAETVTRTNEALRERQEKSQRRKERVVKERQAREEKKLVEQMVKEQQKRGQHQRQVVQELMARKMDKVINQKARHGGDVLDLSFRRLNEVPPTYFKGRDAINCLSSLLIMSLSGNRLQHLPAAMFSHLFVLQVLELSDNEIEQLPEEIGEARDLKSLDIHHNRLATLPLQLKLLGQLTVLNVAHNQLVSFGDVPIKDSNRSESYCVGLVALEELDLSYNEPLQRISEAIGQLRTLKSLRMRGCSSLKKLPDALHDLCSLVVFDMFGSHQKRLGKHVFGDALQNLRSINLAFNSLTSLPEATCQVRNLQELDLSNNGFMAFPECVAMLHELVVFRGARNKMEQLPDRIGELEHLELLDLSRNALRSPLPPSIGLMTYLQHLDLQHNRLSELPTEIGALINVQELNLAWNELAHLPEEMGCMASLRRLDLSHNKLSSMPDAIILWQDLEMFVCSYNRLTTPLSTAIGHLSKIVYLDLSNNRLSSLEPCLSCLRSVEVMNLSGNKLSLLPRELESAPAGQTLKKLDLYNNKISAIPVEWSNLILRLDVFSIGRNPMSMLPEKWSDHWRSGKWQRGDVYGSSSMNGYTSAQVSEWVHDLSVIYPSIVSAWRQNQPFAASDVFVDAVRAIVSSDKWQPRYERIVRHYFYEFKYVGHEVMFEEISEERRANFDQEEKRLRDQQQQRADDAIAENNWFREQFAQAYAFDGASHKQSMEKRRRVHEMQLLRELQHETRQWNEIITEKLPGAVERHEALVFDRNKRFADAMKEEAKLRLLDKQRARQSLGTLSEAAYNEPSRTEE